MANNGIDPLLSGEQDANQLDRINSYRMRAERTFHKSHKELRALIAARRPLTVVVKNEPKLVDADRQGDTQPGPTPDQPAPLALSANIILENEANSAQVRNRITFCELCAGLSQRT